MKKYILFIVLLLFPSLVFATTGQIRSVVMMAKAAAGGIPCTGSNTFLRGANASGTTEDFEYASGDTCTSEWTISGSIGINTYSTSQAKIGTHSIALTDDTSTTPSKVQINLGTGLTDEYYRFYLYIPDLSDNSSFDIGGFSKYNSTVTTAISIIDPTGGTTEYLRIVGSTEYIQVTAGTFVRVEVRAYDDGVSNVVFTMKAWDSSGSPLLTTNGGSDYQVDATSGFDTFQYLTWQPSNNVATSATVYIDGIKNCNTWCGDE